MEHLAATANIRLGRWAEAEAHAHRSLSLLRPHLVRNRAMVSAHLAHAQLAQGALEEAVVAARTVPADIAYSSGRIGHLLDSFGNRIEAIAPGTAEARTWAQYTRDHRRTTG
ncbi:hypothetical protein ABZ547_31095 [Streptomyces sparsogenes]|uniref:hypothetical protein n=1 Tax=Streptomyces sparsogenes TaxID=67365 RepID=UPI00340782B7